MQKIIIFGKSNCQFCRKAKVLAKRVVSNIDANFQYHELSKEETISELQKLGLNIQDFKTYPQIVIETDSNVDYVGGYTEFAQYVQAKEWLKRNIFKKRVNAKPYEYPELLDYVDAIRQSYWTHDEFNYDPDKQDFLINISEKERQVIQRSMLAISQVEVTVKRFWADLYKYFPKPEIDLVGVTFAESECYSPDTEVLTSLGWKRFGELTNDEILAEDFKVAQYDLLTKEIDFTNPKAFISKDYDGLMYLFDSKSTSLFVTENHELVMRQTNKPQRGLFKRRANELKFLRNYAYPKYGFLKSSTNRILTDLERLFIAIQADGSVFANCKSSQNSKRISFSLKKRRKIERLEALLNRLGLKYTKHYKNDYEVFYFNLYDVEFETLRGLKNFDWLDLNNLSQQFCLSFLDELQHWDATQNPKGFTYFSTNEDVIDKVQTIAIFSGSRASKTINRTAEQSLARPSPTGLKKSAKTIFCLSIKPGNEFATYPTPKIVEYNGKVYCFETEKGTLITRRNGKVSINGNCRHFQAYSSLLELLGLDDLFENLDQYPALMERVNYMEKFVETKNLSNEGFTASLILFSMFVEHISLFGQFYTMMSFNKRKNMFKGLSNAIEATSKEEEIHGQFGLVLYNILREEHSEMFTAEFFKQIQELADLAYDAEMQILDWIFEDAEDLGFVSKHEVKTFMEERYNKSLTSLGLEPKYQVDENLLKETKWFELELLTTKEEDFFSKRSTAYSNNSESFDDIF